MAFTVLVKQEAVNDAIEPFEYYENQQEGLGERFLADPGKKIFGSGFTPTHYRFIDEDTLKILRDVHLEKFPYVIVFEISDGNVIVYAIHNTSKNPLRKTKKRQRFIGIIL